MIDITRDVEVEKVFVCSQGRAEGEEVKEVKRLTSGRE